MPRLISEERVNEAARSLLKEQFQLGPVRESLCR
jgi:hypothetical protein